MGIYDRDYMRDRGHGVPTAPKRPSSSRPHLAWWLVAAALVASLAIWPTWFKERMDRLREKIADAVAITAAPTSTRRDTPAPGAAADPAPQRQVTNCLIDGRWYAVEGKACPRPTIRPDGRGATPVVTEAPPGRVSDPLVTPGTIYRCRSYSGGLFWSSAHCRKHDALIDRIEYVPPGLPFNQQVDIAQSQAAKAEARNRR